MNTLNRTSLRPIDLCLLEEERKRRRKRQPSPVARFVAATMLVGLLLFAAFAVPISIVSSATGPSADWIVAVPLIALASLFLGGVLALISGVQPTAPRQVVDEETSSPTRDTRRVTKRGFEHSRQSRETAHTAA